MMKNDIVYQHCCDLVVGTRLQAKSLSTVNSNKPQEIMIILFHHWFGYNI